MSLRRSPVPALAEALGIRPEQIILTAVLTDSTDPGAYWRKLKQRLRDDEGASETVTNCHELKMRAIDGKTRATDAAKFVTAERPTSPLSRVTSIRVHPPLSDIMMKRDRRTSRTEEVYLPFPATSLPSPPPRA